MEHWSIVEDPVSDGGRRGIQNCSSGGQEKIGSSKITIYFEVFCSLLLQYSLAQTDHQGQSHLSTHSNI